MPVVGHSLPDRLNLEKRLIKETLGLQYFRMSRIQPDDKEVPLTNK